STWFTVLLIITNALTVAAAIIVGYGIFFQRKEKEAIQLKAEVKETQFQMYFGPCILAISSLFCGVFVYSFSKNLIPSAISSIGLTEKVSALKLWHGFNFILLASLITLLLGFLLWVKRSFFLNWGKAWVNFVQRVGPTGLYDLALEGLLKIARWITRVFQHGYLRNYLATIISFALLMLGLALFKHSQWPIKLFQFNVLNLLFVVLVLVLVARMVVARSRLNLLVHMGCIGLSITLIFAVYSAPDLALTQALIEILTVLLFVLAVYRLPKFRSFSSWKSKLRDALLAVGMGTVFVIMLMQTAHQSQEPISEYFAKNSYLEAFGKNVVNVILVDFRAFDTLGEITVVAMAGMGIFALLKKATK
ncbi:MAG: DUF4040 domain-containing protein, partial [Deltaproteobacteria bacterium]|nr:DUF4040 domain-containing protein [Deltaproteobacteria bacterium]